MGNAIGAYPRFGTNDIGAYEDYPIIWNQIGPYAVDEPTAIGAYQPDNTKIIYVDGAAVLDKPTTTGTLEVRVAASGELILVGKPFASGTVTITPPVIEPEVPTFTEGEDNGSLLKMNTNIRRGVELIRSGDSTPIIDLDGIRYLLDVDTLRINGTLIWTRFSIATRQPLDSTSFNRRYAAHNIFGELLFSQGQGTPMALQTSTFPIFDIPADNGTVSP